MGIRVIEPEVKRDNVEDDMISKSGERAGTIEIKREQNLVYKAEGAGSGY